MREIARELHVCFFGLQRPFSFLPDTTVWLTAGTVRTVKQNVVSLKLHAMSMCPDTTVGERAHCARGQPNCRIWERPATRCLLTRASMGKNNFYDKMK